MSQMIAVLMMSTLFVLLGISLAVPIKRHHQQQQHHQFEDALVEGDEGEAGRIVREFNEAFEREDQDGEEPRSYDIEDREDNNRRGIRPDANEREAKFPNFDHRPAVADLEKALKLGKVTCQDMFDNLQGHPECDPGREAMRHIITVFCPNSMIQKMNSAEKCSSYDGATIVIS